MEPELFLDLDGVLVNFAEASIAAHGKSLEPTQITWDFPVQIGFESANDPKFWEPLDKEFWATLRWTREGRRLLSGLEQLFGQEHITLMTAPVYSSQKTLGPSVQGKIEWIQAHLPHYVNQAFIGSQKFRAAGPNKFLVDDADHNVVKFRKYNGTAFLVPRPWNAGAHKTGKLGEFNVEELLITIGEELRELRQ